MQNLIKEYGAAIGPALAFVFGLLTLFAKDAFDSGQRRRRAKHVYEIFKRLVLEGGPPAWIEVPPGGGYEAGDANKGNHSRMRDYHRRLIAAQAFVEANERYVAESASLQVVREFFDFKLRFDRLLHFTEPLTRAERPLEELADFGQVQALHRALERTGPPDRS